jgi:hypothetical protein
MFDLIKPIVNHATYKSVVVVLGNILPILPTFSKITPPPEWNQEFVSV